MTLVNATSTEIGNTVAWAVQRARQRDEWDNHPMRTITEVDGIPCSPRDAYGYNTTCHQAMFQLKEDDWVDDPVYGMSSGACQMWFSEKPPEAIVEYVKHAGGSSEWMVL